jgi:hypothetical protein
MKWGPCWPSLPTHPTIFTPHDRSLNFSSPANGIGVKRSRDLKT